MSRIRSFLWALILIAIFSTSLFLASASIDEDIKAAVLVSHFTTNITYANAKANYLFAEVVVNLTRIPNQTIPVDGVTDFYWVVLISNGQVIGSNVKGCSIGQGLSMQQMPPLMMTLGHFGINAIDSNQKLLTWDIWYNSAHPAFTEPLSVRLSKIGYGMISGNESAFNLNLNETLQEVRLSKTEDSYTYGNPNSTPSAPDLSWLLILPLLLSVLLVAVIVRHRKNR